MKSGGRGSGGRGGGRANSMDEGRMNRGHTAIKE